MRKYEITYGPKVKTNSKKTIDKQGSFYYSLKRKNFRACHRYLGTYDTEGVFDYVLRNDDFDSDEANNFLCALFKRGLGDKASIKENQERVYLLLEWIFSQDYPDYDVVDKILTLCDDINFDELKWIKDYKKLENNSDSKSDKKVIYTLLDYANDTNNEAMYEYILEFKESFLSALLKNESEMIKENQLRVYLALARKNLDPEVIKKIISLSKDINFNQLKVLNASNFGAKVYFKANSNKYSLIDYAYETNNAEMFDLLLQNGATFDLKTALNAAIINKSFEKLKILTTYLPIKSELYDAITNKNLEKVKFLLVSISLTKTELSKENYVQSALQLKEIEIAKELALCGLASEEEIAKNPELAEVLKFRDETLSNLPRKEYKDFTSIVEVMLNSYIEVNKPTWWYYKEYYTEYYVGKAQTLLELIKEPKNKITFSDFIKIVEQQMKGEPYKPYLDLLTYFKSANFEIKVNEKINVYSLSKSRNTLFKAVDNGDEKTNKNLSQDNVEREGNILS